MQNVFLTPFFIECSSRLRTLKRAIMATAVPMVDIQSMPASLSFWTERYSFVQEQRSSVF